LLSDDRAKPTHTDANEFTLECRLELHDFEHFKSDIDIDQLLSGITEKGTECDADDEEYQYSVPGNGSGEGGDVSKGPMRRTKTYGRKRQPVDRSKSKKQFIPRLVSEPDTDEYNTDADSDGDGGVVIGICDTREEATILMIGQRPKQEFITEGGKRGNRISHAKCCGCDDVTRNIYHEDDRFVVRELGTHQKDHTPCWRKTYPWNLAQLDYINNANN
jgi:hypothetical protein